MIDYDKITEYMTTMGLNANGGFQLSAFAINEMLDNHYSISEKDLHDGVEWLKAKMKKEVEENRFPGYVLVEMVMTDEAWFVVRNTPNVTGFVGSHGNRSKPTPLLEQEIRDILVSMGQTVQEFDINV